MGARVRPVGVRLAAEGERLLTPAEFGDRLGVSRASAYRIIATGQVAVTPTGTGTKRKRIRISESACEAYIRRKEEPASR